MVPQDELTPSGTEMGIALRANDGETSESLKFSLEGEGHHRGHANQRSEDGQCCRD
jgi:hypothetical protein